MKNPTFGPVFLALGLFCLVLLVPNAFLEKTIPSSIVAQSATALNPHMFHGKFIQDKMLKDPHYLPIYGSSELSRLDQFHPSNYFKVNPSGFTPFLVGKGGTTDLVHFLNLATRANELKNKKIVIILSPQWFTPQGTSSVEFGNEYSNLQAYDYIFHPMISHKLQVEGAKRFLQFKSVRQDRILNTLLEGVVYKDPYHQVKAALVKPIGEFILLSLEKEDYIASFYPKKMKKTYLDPAMTKGVSWETLRDNAEIVAKKSKTSNRFAIDNLDYKKHYKKKIKLLRDYANDLSYAKSPEYGDLQLLLDVLKESKAKALFISVPVNGYWYDYADVSKKGRDVYYKKVKHQIEKAGFPVADYSKYEYDKSFLTDTEHLGWGGWAYIDQSIYQFWNNRPIKVPNQK
jgi:D-alanine transfer protein